MKKILLFAAMIAATQMFIACGGGGGGGGGGSNGGGTVYYPYETVYGEVCSTTEPTPGCTFFRNSDNRITVREDRDYNRHGHGSDDMWYVRFNSHGDYADVYDSTGHFQYRTHISAFKGWISGSTIGVGTTGLFWENVSGGTYWYGRNGVLYSANSWSGNYGEAINNHGASDASDTNMAALSSEANVELVKRAASKLENDYGFEADKAHAVASALNRWGVATAERGFTTATDMDKTFKSVFGVDFQSTLAAVKDLQDGDVSGMQDITQKSADALGLKPHQAQKFIKGMYKKALAQYGYDIEQVQW